MLQGNENKKKLNCHIEYWIYNGTHYIHAQAHTQTQRSCEKIHILRDIGAQMRANIV